MASASVFRGPTTRIGAQISAVAAVFTAVYLRRRTLVPVVGAHVAVWVLSVLEQFYG